MPERVESVGLGDSGPVGAEFIEGEISQRHEVTVHESLFAVAGDTFTTKYAYTADGQVRQVTYPQVTDGDGTVVLGAETVTTRFDSQSNPSWMGGGFGWGIYVAASAWNADGTPAGRDLGNTYGAAVTYGWDEVTGRLTGTSLARQGVPGTELAVGYGYDPSGNVTSLIDTPTNTAAAGQKDAQCFQYDGLQRLQVAWTDTQTSCTRGTVTAANVGGVASYWSEYAYDALGNRTSLTEHTSTGTATTTYQHGAGTAGPHQLTSMTKTTGGVAVTTGYGWDAAGNQTSRTVAAQQQTQTWDAEGKLAATAGATSGDVSNVYGADGSRLVRVDTSGVTVFLPGGQEVHATAAGVAATRWYTFAGATVAVRTGIGLAGVSSVVSDAHGTPLASVKNTDWSVPVTRYRTDPFGAARTGQAGTFAGRGFLSAPTDQTGLTLLGVRFYDPGTGTFLSPDPELAPGVPAQFNAYVYAGNNPVTWADPSGRNWLGQLWGGVTSFVKKNQAEIGGIIAGALVTTGCLAATGGAGSVGCFIAGGAVAGAVTNVWRQAQSGQRFDIGSFARDTLTGGLLGAAGGYLGKFIAPAAGKIVSAVRSALKPAAKTGSSFRAAGSAVRPAASASRPVSSASGNAQQQAASCAVNSFVPGTLVLLADGSKAPIQALKIGDKVLATDPVTGKSTAEPVIATIIGTGEKDLVTVSTTSPGGKTGVVVATAGHPFWVGDRHEWVDAGDLATGDWLRTSAGTWVQVTAVQHDHREQTVHNLTINTTHTYYVYAGDTAILTHNCGGATGTQGWRVGDSIDNLTRAGNSPAWSTVRGRYWKNVANSAVDGEFTAANLTRMRGGKPPVHDEIGVPMELNHIKPRAAGGTHTLDNLEPVWPWEHAAVDPYRHYTGPTP